jgi:hypothetical protein
LKEVAGKSWQSIDRALIQLEALIKITDWRKDAPPVTVPQLPSIGAGKST